MASPLQVLKQLMGEAEDRPQASSLAEIIEGGLRAAAEPESLAAQARPFAIPPPPAQDLTGFAAGLAEAGDTAREAIRARLGLTELVPGPQRAVEPTVVPREETGEGLLSARTVGAVAPFLLGAGPAAAARSFLTRGALGATETLATTFEPGETTLGEAALLGGAGFAGGAILGPRSPLSPSMVKGFRGATDEIAASNLVAKLPKLSLKKEFAETLPSGARAASAGTQPFRRLEGDPQFQADTIAKKVFRDEYGFDDKTIKRFMARLTPEERSGIALERTTALTKAASAIKTAAGGDTKLAEDAQRVILSLKAPRTALTDEAGFLQLGRMIEGSPEPLKILRHAASKGKKGIRYVRIKAQPLILSAYMSNPVGRLKDLTSTAANTASVFASVGAKSNHMQAFAGTKAAMWDGWRSSVNAWRTGMNRDLREAIKNGVIPKEMIDELESLGRITPEIATAVRAGKASLPEEALEGVVMLSQGKRIRDMLGRLPYFATRINAWSDDLFTPIAANLRANYKATRKAVAEGAKGDKLAERFMFHRANLTDDELNAAWDEGRRVSFREHNIAPGTEAAIAGGRLVRRIPVLGDLILAPFVRTPTVMGQRNLEYNPAAFLLGGYRALSVDPTDQLKGSLNMQRATMGLMGTAAATTLAEMGVITGKGEHLSQSEKDALTRVGRWQATSIKWGDLWIDYSGWGTVAGLLSLGANLSEKVKAGRIQLPEDYEDYFRQPLSSIATTVQPGNIFEYGKASLQSVLDTTYLPDLAKFITNLAEGRRSGENLSDSLFRLLQPFGLISAIAQAMDPRRTGGAGPLESIAERIPGARSRGSVPELGSQTFGESPEVPGGPGFLGAARRLFTPRTIQRSQDPLVNFLADRGMLPGRPSLPVFDKAEKIRLTDSEKNTILLAKGRAERRAMERAVGSIEFNVALKIPDKNLSLARQREILKRELDKARTAINTAVRERKRRGLPLDLRVLLLQTG